MMKKIVKSKLSDVIKSSGGAAVAVDATVMDVSTPVLQPPQPINPNFFKEDIDFGKPVLEPSPYQEYDAQFFVKAEEFGDEMRAKDKFVDAMKSPNFKKEILFAYTHPSENGLGRAAKKFAFQAANRSMRSIDAEKIDTVHRESLKRVIDAIVNKSYVAHFREQTRHLPEEEQFPLLYALHHPTVRSYLSDALRDHFYAIEKVAAKATRESYGVAESYLFVPDKALFDSEMLLRKEGLFHAELSKMHLPLQVTRVLEASFYTPLLIKKYPKAEEAFNKVNASVEQAMLRLIYGADNASQTTRLSQLQDHLFFQKMYREKLETYHPPLTTEDKSLLSRHSTGGGIDIPESLKRCYDITYNEAKADTIHHFNLLPTWEPDKQLMHDAMQLVKFAKQAARTLKIASDIAVKALNGLIDRKTIGQSDEVDNAFHAITSMAMSHFYLLTNPQLKELRTLSDTAIVIEELEKELGPLSAEEVGELLQGKGQFGKAAIAKVKEERGLPPEWKVNIAKAQAIANGRTKETLLQQLHRRYCDELFNATRDVSASITENVSDVHRLLEGCFDKAARFRTLRKEALYQEIAASVAAGIPAELFKQKGNDAVKHLDATFDDAAKTKALQPFMPLIRSIVEIEQAAVTPFKTSVTLPQVIGQTKTDNMGSFIETIQKLLNECFTLKDTETLSYRIAAAVEHALASLYLSRTPSQVMASAAFATQTLFPERNEAEHLLHAFIAEVTITASLMLAASIAITLNSGAAATTLAGTDTHQETSKAQPSSPILNDIANAIKQTKTTLAQGMVETYDLDNTMFSAVLEGIENTVKEMNTLVEVTKFESQDSSRMKSILKALLNNRTALTAMSTDHSVITQCAAEYMTSNPHKKMTKNHHDEASESKASQTCIATHYGVERSAAAVMKFLSENIALLATGMTMLISGNGPLSSNVETANDKEHEKETVLARK